MGLILGQRVPIMLAGEGEQWRVLEALGQGATSQVWLIERHGERLALKVGRSLAEAHRLADEAERLAFIDSPLVPRVRCSG